MSHTRSIHGEGNEIANEANNEQMNYMVILNLWMTLKNYFIKDVEQKLRLVYG